ncbi:MAG TPA: efflux RND transporter permease subunit [Bryobacteraceae bacterium]|nr:CusA/CzcA family heavy metal efflux RND transporter [Bryobacterales bacterium]HRJ20136.1 efflux RND transporter permease subunit [Bryobacteraceae bacterium]
MLDGLIRWSLRNRAAVVFLTSALLIWGGYTLRTIPLDVLPDLTAPTVTVLVEGRGMAPTELEALVTFPIESALNGAPGVRRIRSATAVGVAVIWVEFQWGEDIYRARQTVNERLALASATLPAGVDPPYLAPISSIMGDVLFVTLESDRHSQMELRTIAETTLRRRLLAVPGVAQVVPSGGDIRQYQVLVDPTLLRQFDVSLDDVQSALGAGSQNASAGFRVTGGQEYLIQGVGRAATEADIGAIALTARAGRPIFIRDIAQVRIGPGLKRSAASHDAKPAIILGIQKQPGANTLVLTQNLDAILDDIQSSLPAGMVIDKNVFRAADFIERALSNLSLALRDGALLVVIVVALFMMNFRAAFITLLAIPISLLAAVLTMNWFGFTLNTMSLGGLAIAIGELVDDAIIDVENVMRRLRQNSLKPEDERLPPLEVIYRASSEIRSSVFFATVIVILVFLPLFALSSVEGRLLTPLAFAYIVSLTASLVVALTITPALCSFLLPNARSVLKGHEPWLVTRLKRIFQPSLRWSLDHPALLAGSAFLLLAVAGFFLARAGRSFLPEFNEGTLTVSAVTLPGTSLADSDHLARALERILLSVPEVSSTARRTGRAELDEHVQGVESSELEVTLDMRDRSKEEILADIRQRVALLPGMNVTLGQPISHRIDHMLSGTRANIAVKIFGDDLLHLRALAAQAQAAIRSIPGVVDLSIEQQTDIPTVRVRVRPEDAARHGLRPGEVATKIQTAFIGIEVNRVLEGQLSFPLVVRYPETPMHELASIGHTLIDAPSGAKIPLHTVADIYEDRSPNFISRENGQRKIVVQCNVAGRDLLGVVREIEAAVNAGVPMPAGYRVEYGGQFESEAEASRRLLLLGGAVILAILLLLASAFHSTRDALIIMLNLPLALVGGVVGVYLAGGVLSVASIIGFIALFGIATRNGIMLIAHIRHLREKEGVTDLRQAVLAGATERLSPILMTALTAALALVPIAAGMGKPGSEIQAPMAMVILFGLISSTALNMVVVPAIYYATNRPR